MENTATDTMQRGIMPVGSEEYINEVFTYHAPDEQQKKQYEVLRAAAKDFARVLAATVPASPDRSVAFRSLRECVMTANAAIALHGQA